LPNKALCSSFGLAEQSNYAMKTYDVIIIGAGLAGLQCARLLGRQGFKVLLVDRKPSLDQSVHTTGIFVRRTLEDFDLPEDCLGPPVRHVNFYSPARRLMELESPHDEFRVGHMGKLYQRLLDHCLRAGVEWLPATRYLGHCVFKNDLVVRIEGQGFSRWVRTHYVVGADGAKSRVAQDLGLDVNHEWIVGVEEVFEGAPLDGPPKLHCFLDPQLAPGYLAWVVNDGEQVHVGVGGYPSEFNPLIALQNFRAGLGNILDLDRAHFVERRGGRIPVGGVLRNIANDRGLLLGDAAGAVSPLTAGGLDPCMRLSSFAATVIGEYLISEDPKILSKYSGELFRARFVSRLWMRRLATQVKHPALIELGCAAMRLPVMKYFAWHVFFGRGSFPDVESRVNVEPAIQSG
jgi:flavin-dependent dehydrogenase